jgi:SAM-dependent methyltransferase
MMEASNDRMGKQTVTLLRVLRAAVGLNEMISRWLDRRWPYPLAQSFWRDYERTVAACAAEAPEPTIVDIGAGAETPYVRWLQDRPYTVTGIDALEGALASNPDISVAIQRDVCKEGLPRSLKAGIITSRMVLEHIPELERLTQEMFAALLPDGRVVHLFAGRYSLFAVLNRLLPPAVARRLLFVLRPSSREVGGFEAYYDQTHVRGVTRLFREAGFVQVDVRVSYQVSQYCRFLFPLYLMARLYETAIHALGVSDLGAFVLLTAHRPGQ